MHPHSAPPARPAPASPPDATRVSVLAAERRPAGTGRRRRVVGAGALALLLVAGAGLRMLARRPLPPEPVRPSPTWHLDVRADGGRAPWTLVFGREAGLYLVRASEAGRVAALPAGVPGREVSIVSLGWAPLTARGDAGGAGGLRSFSARAHVITVYQDDTGTGVRTGF